MSFLRPEIHAFAVKWREALVLLGIALMAAAAAVRLWPNIFFVGLSALLFAVALCLSYIAMRRVRLRDAGIGRGYIEVQEQEIRFFASDDGGMIALDDLDRVDISTDLLFEQKDQHYWILSTRLRSPLIVPGNAQGIEDLITAISALPGVDLDGAMRFISSGASGPKLIWQKAGAERLNVPKSSV